MNILKYVVLLSMFWLTPILCYAANPVQIETIQLTKTEDIKDASTLNEAIDSTSNKVMECVQGKLAPSSECFCLYPKELSHLKKVYEDTLKQHPNWKDKAISYMQNGRTIATSLYGVGRQLEVKCPQAK